jgi:Bacterial protein of unknown function (DUF885)
MKTVVRFLGAALLVMAGAVRADWIERSDEITMEVFRAQAQFIPETATYLGLAEFDAEVSSLEKGVREASIASDKELIAKLQVLLKKEDDASVRQDIEILLTDLEEGLTSEFLHHSLMIPYHNLHRDLFGSFQSLLDPRNDPERYPAALERLRKYNGSAEGYNPITEQAMAQSTERFNVEGVTGPYIAELENDLKSAPHLKQGIHDLFQASGLEGWEQDYELLASQLDEYGQWLDTRMRTHTRENNLLPPAIYADNLINYGVKASPEELISTAQYSYQLLRSEMKAIAWRIAEERNWEKRDLVSVIRALKAEQLAPEDVLPLYKERLAAVEEIIRREDIISLPERPAGIRLATEAEAAAIPASFMSPPQLIGNTGQFGEFVLVQSNPTQGEDAAMDDWSHDSITWALTVHEARPGHELQFARLVEDGTSLARAIYAFNSANAEGWGLYAESIMQEYLPLEGQLFNLYTRIMRAARMFLDPMVNTGQLSHEGARDFLVEQIALSPAMAASEADRYAFRSPGQATSYYYGYMSLSRLRTEVELALGFDFNQRAYHDFILRQGLLPPELLRQAVLEEFVR